MKVILVIFAFIFPLTLSFAKNINDAIDSILSEENYSKDTCIFGKNVELLILDKIEGMSEAITIPINKESKYNFLNIRVSKCCSSPTQSYAFTNIVNTKMKKEVFKGWMFSKNSNRNSLEDSKFEVTLLKCF